MLEHNSYDPFLIQYRQSGDHIHSVAKKLTALQSGSAKIEEKPAQGNYREIEGGPGIVFSPFVDSPVLIQRLDRAITQAKIVGKLTRLMHLCCISTSDETDSPKDALKPSMTIEEKNNFFEKSNGYHVTFSEPIPPEKREAMATLMIEMLQDSGVRSITQSHPAQFSVALSPSPQSLKMLDHALQGVANELELQVCPSPNWQNTVKSGSVDFAQDYLRFLFGNTITVASVLAAGKEPASISAKCLDSAIMLGEHRNLERLGRVIGPHNIDLHGDGSEIRIRISPPQLQMHVALNDSDYVDSTLQKSLKR